MKRVFISYARERSGPLARLLTERLNEVRIDAWRDREQLVGGDRLDRALDKAIEGADAVVFLVTRDSLTRRYPQDEVDAAAAYAASEDIRLIPVICASDIEQKDLPLSLKGIVAEKWYDGDGLPDDDARLWRIVCAIKPEPDVVLGPERAWSQSWRDHVAKYCLGIAALKTKVVAKTPRVEKRSPQQRPSLDCGRDIEWVDVETLYSSETHAMAVVTGPAGEAHDHFLRRIQYFLPHEKPRRVEWVNWRPRPRSREEFCEALIEALDAGTENLVDELKWRLSTHNLILLHDVVDSKFGDVLLKSYYGEWLPELLQEVEPQMKLVCVQPVAWRKMPTESPNWFRDMASRFLARLGGKGTESDEERSAWALSRDLMKTDPVVTAHLAVKLTEVHEDHVERFCKRHQFDPVECETIVSASRRGPQINNSEDVLNAVDHGVETVMRLRFEKHAHRNRGK